MDVITELFSNLNFFYLYGFLLTNRIFFRYHHCQIYYYFLAFLDAKPYQNDDHLYNLKDFW